LASVAQIRTEYRNKKSTGPANSVRAYRPGHRNPEDHLATLRREYDDLRHAMYDAAQIQRRLCGPRHLRAAGYEFASEIFPVRHLSGDFITQFQIERDLVFAIGDITGKGLMAAMWFTHVIGMIRRQMSALGDPAAALSSLNRELLLTGFEVPLTTLFVARLNLDNGNLTYCNAGHPPALLLRENNEPEELGVGGPALGAIFDASFQNGNAKVCPGNTVFAYSDGISECRNGAGTEFGAKNLLNAARAFSGCKPSVMLFSMLAAVENFAGSQHREDDVALMVLHRIGSRKIN
jgi:serine phosphatase RsbU (regulator of sigma subunit)